MKTSQAGLEAVKDYLGIERHAQLDDMRVITIGVHHTKGVKLGDVITDAQADELLREDLEEAEDAVNDLVTVELTQGQFDALVSLVSFIKRSDFANSSLLRFLNRGEYLRAANEFPRYSIENGYVQPALVKRRYAERARFMETIT